MTLQAAAKIVYSAFGLAEETILNVTHYRQLLTKKVQAALILAEQSTSTRCCITIDGQTLYSSNYEATK